MYHLHFKKNSYTFLLMFFTFLQRHRKTGYKPSSLMETISKGTFSNVQLDGF